MPSVCGVAYQAKLLCRWFVSELVVNEVWLHQILAGAAVCLWADKLIVWLVALSIPITIFILAVLVLIVIRVYLICRLGCIVLCMMVRPHLLVGDFKILVPEGDFGTDTRDTRIQLSIRVSSVRHQVVTLQVHVRTFHLRPVSVLVFLLVLDKGTNALCWLVQSTSWWLLTNVV